MAIRKHRAGELVVEQTRDLAIVRAMLERGGMTTAGIEWPAACYIVAYLGDDAVGVIGVEPKIDAALIRSLYVNESMRRRGIGGALLAAARKAAHTHGARSSRARLDIISTFRVTASSSDSSQAVGT